MGYYLINVLDERFPSYFEAKSQIKTIGIKRLIFFLSDRILGIIIIMYLFIIKLSNISILSAHDKGYFRNASCPLHLICVFLIKSKLYMKGTEGNLNIHLL